MQIQPSLSQQLQYAMSQLVCSGNNPVALFCISDRCKPQLSSVICNTDTCPYCQRLPSKLNKKNYDICAKQCLVSSSNLIQKILNKRKPLSQCQKNIANSILMQFDEMIDQISEARQIFQSITDFYGMSIEEVQLIQQLKKSQRINFCHSTIKNIKKQIENYNFLHFSQFKGQIKKLKKTIDHQLRQVCQFKKYFMCFKHKQIAAFDLTNTQILSFLQQIETKQLRSIKIEKIKYQNLEQLYSLDLSGIQKISINTTMKNVKFIQYLSQEAKNLTQIQIAGTPNQAISELFKLPNIKKIQLTQDMEISMRDSIYKQYWQRKSNKNLYDYSLLFQKLKKSDFEKINLLKFTYWQQIFQENLDTSVLMKLSSLKYLNIQGLKNIKMPQLQNATNLKGLRIKNIKLQKGESLYLWKHLKNLQRLSIIQCYGQIQQNLNLMSSSLVQLNQFQFETQEIQQSKIDFKFVQNLINLSVLSISYATSFLFKKNIQIKQVNCPNLSSLLNLKCLLLILSEHAVLKWLESVGRLKNIQQIYLISKFSNNLKNIVGLLNPLNNLRSLKRFCLPFFLLSKIITDLQTELPYNLLIIPQICIIDTIGSKELNILVNWFRQIKRLSVNIEYSYTHLSHILANSNKLKQLTIDYCTSEQIQKLQKKGVKINLCEHNNMILDHQNYQKSEYQQQYYYQQYYQQQQLQNQHDYWQQQLQYLYGTQWLQDSF